METAKRCGIQEGAVGLGNFLSGMETYPETGRRRAGREPLETSLVEWKRVGRAGDGEALLPWKLP